MTDLCVDDGEEILPNSPKPKVKPVQVHFFVDSDHAGDRATQRSQTGIILYSNSAPIIWYSWRKNTVQFQFLGQNL